MSDRHDPSPVSRGRLVELALHLLQAEGLDALTMRGLADRLAVRAASLYWHVRDRRELIELLADELLAEVRPAPPGAGWRGEALALCQELARMLGRRRDAARVLLESPESLQRSALHQRLRAALARAGLGAAEASEMASLLLAHVLLSARRTAEPPSVPRDRPVRVAVDSGSRGVTLRAGPPMPDLARAVSGSRTAAPTVVRGDTVVVRRLRGRHQGEVELNPIHPWRVKVQAPTVNTVLDLGGLDVREIQVDSGAVRVEAILPRPTGVVPIHISSGVVGVRLRRPAGVAVVADIHTGSLRVRLDSQPVRAAMADVRWTSHDGADRGDRYHLTVSSGVVGLTLEQEAEPAATPTPTPSAGAAPAQALEIALDGVARRTTAGA